MTWAARTPPDTLITGPPVRRPVMRQTWRDVSFAHWPVDPGYLRPSLPAGVELDTIGGRAWISLVGFEMCDLRLTGLPTVPTTGRFSEFNVRTYVTGRHGPGVWFYSLDIPNRLPTWVARTVFALPYCTAKIKSSHSRTLHSWSVQRRWPDRCSGSLTVRVGDPIDEQSVLDRFLTARWRLYARTPFRGRLLTAPIHHEPWPLHAGEAIEFDTGIAGDLAPLFDGEPVVHHAPVVSVRVGRPRWA